MEDKRAAARRLRDELGISRTILVDDLEGTVHGFYGLMPNMSWVLDRGGTILYKATWTSAERIGEFLDRLHGRPRALGYAPFQTEQLELRSVDADSFRRGLARNGPKAVAEFERAEQIWTDRARAARGR